MKMLVFSVSCLCLMPSLTCRAANWGFWDDNRSYVALELRITNVYQTNWYTLWSDPSEYEPRLTNQVIGVNGPLGTFNPNVGDSLRIVAYDTKTWKFTGTGGDVTACEYFYTAYQDGNRGTPTFTSIGGGWLEDLDSDGNQRWGNGAVNSANILSGISTVTNRIEMYGRISGPSGFQYDNNDFDADNYNAQFIVIPEGGVVTLLATSLGWLCWRKR